MTEEDKIALLEKQQDYLAYDRYEYPMMARIFHNKNIKTVKIFGGFFNLYFFYIASTVGSLKGTNIDSFKEGDRLRSRHTLYKKIFNFKGEYSFHNREANQEDLSGDYDCVWDDMDLQRHNIKVDRIKDILYVYTHNSNPLNFSKVQWMLKHTDVKVISDHLIISAKTLDTDVFDGLDCIVQENSGIKFIHRTNGLTWPYDREFWKWKF